MVTKDPVAELCAISIDNDEPIEVEAGCPGKRKKKRAIERRGEKRREEKRKEEKRREHERKEEEKKEKKKRRGEKSKEDDSAHLAAALSLMCSSHCTAWPRSRT